MNDTARMIRLLRRLRTETNGAVSEAMAERGIRYPLNYGVSVPTIRNIAGEFGPDHSLAMLLFAQDVRELQLAALFIDDPRQVTVEQLHRWSRAFRNTEIVEQAAMRHLSKTPDAQEICREWIAAPDPLLRYAAIQTLRWMIRNRNEQPFDETFITDALERLKIMVNEFPADPVTANGLIVLMPVMAGFSPLMQRQIVDFADTLCENGDLLYRHAGSEAKALLG